MAIDTKELRRLAQEAMHPVTKGRWMHLFGESTVYDRLEDGCRGIPVVSTPFSPSQPFEAACLDFIAAANPAAISEILNRLEAAEQTAQDCLRIDREKAQIAQRLEAAEKERDDVAWQLAQSEQGKRKISEECDALRAKIAEMERQEPVAWLHETRRDSDVVTDAVKHVWGKVAVGAMASYSIPLYALPGAQPAPSVPSDLHSLETVRFWADAYTHPGDDNFRGHAMAAALLREYAELRAALAGEAKP